MVAAYGPRWSAGGDRGILKLHTEASQGQPCVVGSENTAINEYYGPLKTTGCMPVPTGSARNGLDPIGSAWGRLEFIQEHGRS